VPGVREPFEPLLAGWRQHILATEKKRQYEECINLACSHIPSSLSSGCVRGDLTHVRPRGGVDPRGFHLRPLPRDKGQGPQVAAVGALVLGHLPRKAAPTEHPHTALVVPSHMPIPASHRTLIATECWVQEGEIAKQ